MERDTMMVCREVYNYWHDILLAVESPEVNLDLRYSIYDFDPSILELAVRVATPDELYHALESDDEELKFYHMDRIWRRYMDIKAGRTVCDGDTLAFTQQSSIHELDITITSLQYLHQFQVEFLWQIPEKLENVPYATALDVTAALSLLKGGRQLC